MHISLKNLKAKAVIGVHDWEQKIKQNIIINIVVRLNDEKSASSDLLADTLDYQILQDGIIGLVESKPFALIERMAKEIMSLVLSQPLIDHVSVEVDKPEALNCCDSVSVQMEKSKNNL